MLRRSVREASFGPVASQRDLPRIPRWCHRRLRPARPRHGALPAPSWQRPLRRRLRRALPRRRRGAILSWAPRRPSFYRHGFRGWFSKRPHPVVIPERRRHRAFRAALGVCRVAARWRCRTGLCRRLPARPRGAPIAAEAGPRGPGRRRRSRHSEVGGSQPRRHRPGADPARNG